MKTPNTMLMVVSMGRALFTVKVAVADGEGKVGARAYIACRYCWVGELDKVR